MIHRLVVRVLTTNLCPHNVDLDMLNDQRNTHRIEQDDEMKRRDCHQCLLSGAWKGAITLFASRTDEWEILVS